MTKKEIIDAAFKVWGREFYLNTSLSHVAAELKVCKPALYRHFISKQNLLEAMTRHFFDDFASFIQEDYKKALIMDDYGESMFIVIRSVAEYYARNVNIFIFSMIKLHDNQLDSFNIVEELCIRGVDLGFLGNLAKKNFVFEPPILKLIFATLTFFMSGFHKTRKSLTNPPGEKEIYEIIRIIDEITGKGLGYTKEEIFKMDFEKLENRIAGTIDAIEDNPLLKAVAEAVAQAGPWEASMEQVARISGLSKSSLYCHFKSRQDMLYRLFMTESLRIINFSRQAMQQSLAPLEQLYLGIYSIAEYLRSKPDILVALDWLRNRRLELNPPDKKPGFPPAEFRQVFNDIKIEILHSGKSPFRGMFSDDEDSSGFSLWVLFLIVNTLMRKEQGQALGNVPNSDIRCLFKFLTMGIGGFKNQLPC